MQLSRLYGLFGGVPKLLLFVRALAEEHLVKPSIFAIREFFKVSALFWSPTARNSFEAAKFEEAFSSYLNPIFFVSSTPSNLEICAASCETLSSS